MGNILLPIQWQGVGQGVCPATLDALGLVLSNAMKAVLSGATFYNRGDTLPPPELQGFDWFRTVDSRWYFYDGAWISHNNYSQFDRRMFPGTLTDLITYDGGDNQAPSDRSGPMWVVDDTFMGRVPIGVGTIPGTTTPVITTNVGDQVGAAEHTLTEGEGAVGQHTHPVGTFGSGDDVNLSYPGLQTTPSFQTRFVQGTGNAPIIGTETQADVFTLPANNGNGVTGTPFQLVPPATAVYLIKPSGRLYYRV